jgi:glucose-6-phosphate 1-dehydrogenase
MYHTLDKSLEARLESYMIARMKQAGEPLSIVLYGATGDLVSRKIVPALFHLFQQGRLPSEFHIFGYGRKPWSHLDFQARGRQALEEHAQKDFLAEKDEFLKHLSYIQGEMDDSSGFTALRASIEDWEASFTGHSNRMIYLAVPPELYRTIFVNIKNHQLIQDEHGYWTRVLVEKPIGTNAQTAEELDGFMRSILKEDQLYRIEHYLAKHLIQNLLVFRFSNSLFERVWNRDFIERIDIRLWETVGVETRGALYDGLGALRDVGQNHVLQMLALVAMEHPQQFTAEAIRRERSQVLRSLKWLSGNDVFRLTERRQYQGYSHIPGVKEGSRTETYFRIQTELENDRWRGVPIYLESGKRLKEVRKEIVVTFKQTPPLICADEGAHHQNRIVFSLAPQESIQLQLWIKKPDHGFEIERRSLEMKLREVHGSEVAAYERVLLDCLRGDQTLFLGTDELHAMWRFIDPILEGWAKDPSMVQSYKPDGWAPEIF